MRAITTIILILISIFNILGQSYRAIKTNAGYYFKYDSIINSIKIDSMNVVGNDTILYNFKCMRNAVPPETCSNLYGPSWIGKKVIIKSDGYNIFLNKYNDTIKINPLANLNDSFILYKYSNSNYIEATITNFDTASFIGFVDSVKTISLLVKDTGDDTISDFLNNKTIMLSKNYGLIKLPDFYEFPYDSIPDITSLLNIYAYNYKPFYNLVGKTNPNAGIVNITSKEIFDFNIGDEFHTEDINTLIGPQSKWKLLLISIIIDKSYSNFNDTVIYKVKRCGSEETWDTSSYKFSYINDTVFTSYAITNNILDYQPRQTFYDKNGYFGYSFFDLNISSLYNNRLLKHNLNLIPYSFSNDSCYNIGPILLALVIIIVLKVWVGIIA